MSYPRVLFIDLYAEILERSCFRPLLPILTYRSVSHAVALAQGVGTLGLLSAVQSLRRMTRPRQDLLKKGLLFLPVGLIFVYAGHRALKGWDLLKVYPVRFDVAYGAVLLTIMERYGLPVLGGMLALLVCQRSPRTAQSVLGDASFGDRATLRRDNGGDLPLGKIPRSLPQTAQDIVQRSLSGSKVFWQLPSSIPIIGTDAPSWGRL